MELTLIANSGIQFHTFEMEVDSNENFSSRVGYYEHLNEDIELTLSYAYYFADEEIWVEKRDLRQEKYLDREGKLSTDIDFSKLLPLPEKDCYRINNLPDCLELYGDAWLPIPYFILESGNNVRFGPTAWARMYIRKLEGRSVKKNDPKSYYQVTLAFDTQVTSDGDNVFMPCYEYIENEVNTFVLSDNDDWNLNFLSAGGGVSWVSNYLEEVASQRTKVKGLKFAAQFLFLVKALAKKEVFPRIKLFSDKTEPIDVSLVLDIGNANTCGLLFESPAEREAFRFTNVKKLKLVNLSDPATHYDRPFDMRVAFAKADFGKIQNPNHPGGFAWHSFVRVGKEALQLISANPNDTDKLMHSSSPKRYLWDEDRSRKPWHFVSGERVYVKGLTECFDEKGTVIKDDKAAEVLHPHYSRRALMTFVYIEIFLQALAQINSHEFRYDHPERRRPRRLRRVIITCPTAVIQHEQVMLRQCAQEAAFVLDKLKRLREKKDEEIAKSPYGKSRNQAAADKNPVTLEVLPSVKDLARGLDELDDKRDWIYDEATCCQLVFLYGEISKRYIDNASLFFELFGKKRGDLVDTENRAVTVGTVDIGGGTTDLMICAYQNQGQSNVLLEPTPLYWESFSLAGDNLLRDVVQKIVLEGRIQKEAFRGCTGVIENYLKDKGCSNVVGKMNDFFGSDAARQTNEHRAVVRRDFVVQVLKPIAERYLAHACTDEPDRELGFEELFPEIRPNEALLQKFDEFFGEGICFKDIRWKLSRERVFEVLKTAFDKLFGQLSILLHSYGCDFLLLTGQVTNIPKLRELFLKYYPVSPDRVVSLNRYRVGTWYPYSDEIGRFQEPKTIVCVGALIAAMGGKYDALEGFRIHTSKLCSKLVSTADYMGVLNRHTHDMETSDLLFTKDRHSNMVKVSTLPTKLGYKQMENYHYPCRPIYQIAFDYEEMKNFFRRDQPNVSDAELKDLVDKREAQLTARMPFRVRISRDRSKSKEHITVEEVLDKDGDEIPAKWLKMAYMTLPEPQGFWLDTGEFTLSIKQ